MKNNKWGYSGNTAPEYWEKLLDEFKDCGGTKQSPINISKSIKKNSLTKIEFWTGIANIRKQNSDNFHVYFVENSHKLKLDDKEYELIQFHFHTGSEHTVNNHQAKMEIHFVHQSEDNNLLVIGVFAELGEKNKTLSDVFLMANHIQLELKELLPKDKSYYTYSGSLTTPPCTEGIKWVVFKNSISIDRLTLQKWEKLLKNNFRPPLAVNGRKIFFKPDI